MHISLNRNTSFRTESILAAWALVVPLLAAGCVMQDPTTAMDASTGTTNDSGTNTDPTDAGTDSGTPDAGPTGGDAGACDLSASSSFCVDYVGSAWTAMTVESSCATQIGDYLASGCPTGDLVGTCEVDFSGDPTLKSVYYYYSTGGLPQDAVSAEATCTTLGGAFTPA